MSSRKITFFCLAIVIALLLYWWLYRPSAPQTPSLSKPTIPSAPIGKITPLSDDRGRQVDRLLKEHRFQIAACLMSAESSRANQIRLTLTWDALANLQQIDLHPDLGSPTKECLKGVVKPWKVSPSLDSSPFSFTKRLKVK